MAASSARASAVAATAWASWARRVSASWAAPPAFWAAAWASASGIAAGYGDGAFRPNAPVTREELAALLYRYAGWKQADVTARGDLSIFADEASVGAWSRDAMAWACGTGLLTGTERNTLEPKSGATRARTAVILTRWLALSDQDG